MKQDAYLGTLRHGNPLKTAKEIVTQGLKWPPEVGAQTVKARTMPIA